jgi:hypothetical protein
MDRDAWQASFERFLAEPGSWKFLVQWARTSACLPIYCDWTHAFGLTADGDVIAFEHEPWPVPTSMQIALPETPCLVSDERLLNLGLHQGAKRYPWLSALLPARPSDAQVCSMCNGTGNVPVPDLICYCGGAGWVPRGDTWVNKDRFEPGGPLHT